MKIFYIGAFRFPLYDAAAARILNVARALRLAGHQVSFISWGGKRRPEDQTNNGQLVYDGFPYVVTDEIDANGGFHRKFISRMTRGCKTKYLLKERLGEYDVIITYNCSLIGWLVSFCRKNRVYLVSDLTEWYANNELYFYERLSYWYQMHVLQKRICNKLVISTFLDDYYSQTHNIVVPATCDASESKWQCVVVDERIAPFDGITLIYAGNPARKDAVHCVINAVNALADDEAKVRFLIIGITKEQYLEKYKGLLKRKKLNDSIKFLGRVSQDDVPSYYALADFMVLLREPTRKSNAGFPTKFSESFTSGTPVIANLTSDLGLYLKDGETGFVIDNPSEEAIYRTLKEKVLHLNKEDIESLKRNVRETAKQLDYHAFVEPLRIFMNDLR